MRQRVMWGAAMALLGGTWLLAQSTTAAQDKLFKMVEKCQIDQLQQELGVTPAAVLNARNADGVPLIVRAAETTCDQGIEQMILTGADANAADGSGRTVLHAAAEKSTDKVVKMLLNRGAKIDAVTKSGETVLQAAEKNMYKGKTETRDKIIKLLKEKGAK